MKKIVLIDIDDVISDNVYLKVLNKMLGTNKTEVECNEYHVEDNFSLTDKQIENYYNELGRVNPYEYSIIKPNCKETIEKLCEKYDVYICSAAALKENLKESGNYFKYKYDYIINNFPFLNPFNIIFTNNKPLIKGDILIDDKPANFVGGGFSTKILFTAFHNKNLTDEDLKKQGLIRVDNWKEIADILL